MFRTIFLLSSFGLAASALADGYLRDQAEVEALLTGATLDGIYLRTNSAYRLTFREDGTLDDGREAAARWWISEQGQYCREWLAGPLAGNEGCMDIRLHKGQVQLFFDGRQVAEGVLQR